MVSPQSENKGSVPCDFCSEQVAVLYCRADTAKLCLFCDQHVHSANLLSRKHLRSQICDNCSTEPVSVRCTTDNLVLCQECDSDAHGSCAVSASHDRTPIEGFTECPTAIELASLWGLDLEEKKSEQSQQLIQNNWSRISVGCGGGGCGVHEFEGWGCKSGGTVSFQDLMVPNGNSLVYGNVSGGEIVLKGQRQQQQQSPCCGKYKHVIYKQLLELFKRDLMGGDCGGGGGGDVGGGENLVMETPSKSLWQGNVETVTLGNGNNNGVTGVVAGGGLNGSVMGQQSLQQDRHFSSLHMLPNDNAMDLKRGRGCGGRGGDMLWDTNANASGTQIWDFHLGKLRNHDESGQLEIANGASDAGFMLKNFGELMKETSLTNAKMLGDIYQINCPITHDDLASFNNNANNPTGSQGPATSESNNLPIARPSSAPAFGKPKGSSGCKDVQFMEQSIPLRGDGVSRVAPTKADMELLAQNRGNAMQRYKEKKKTRRYDKHIRYESRKARAETRKRVKGRFVKASESLDG